MYPEKTNQYSKSLSTSVVIRFTKNQFKDGKFDITFYLKKNLFNFNLI